jgi:hypothetical protein
VYCGLYADTIDHIPPRSVRPTLQSQGLADKYRFLEVHACKECNCLAGAHPPWTLAGRKKLVKNKLRKRYKKYLKLPLWSETELEELGRNMRSEVEQALLVKDMIEQRFKW